MLSLHLSNSYLNLKTSSKGPLLSEAPWPHPPRITPAGHTHFSEEAPPTCTSLVPHLSLPKLHPEIIHTSLQESLLLKTNRSVFFKAASLMPDLPLAARVRGRTRLASPPNGGTGPDPSAAPWSTPPPTPQLTAPPSRNPGLSSRPRVCLGPSALPSPIQSRQGGLTQAGSLLLSLWTRQAPAITCWSRPRPLRPPSPRLVPGMTDLCQPSHKSVL